MRDGRLHTSDSARLQCVPDFASSITFTQLLGFGLAVDLVLVISRSKVLQLVLLVGRFLRADRLPCPRLHPHLTTLLHAG